MSEKAVQETGGVVVHGVVPLSCLLIELCLYYPPPGCKTGCKIRASYTHTRRYILQKTLGYDYAQKSRKGKGSIIDLKPLVSITLSGFWSGNQILIKCFCFRGWRYAKTFLHGGLASLVAPDDRSTIAQDRIGPHLQLVHPLVITVL